MSMQHQFSKTYNATAEKVLSRKKRNNKLWIGAKSWSIIKERKRLKSKMESSGRLRSRHKTKDKECRDGAVLRALASHQCGLGSICRSGIICGLSLLVLYSAPRGFLRVLRVPLSSKTNI